MLGPVLLSLKTGDEIPRSDDAMRLEQPRRFWSASYEASKLDYFDAGDVFGRPILEQHERETVTRYARRRAQAIVRSYVRHLVDRYVDHACRQEPTRATAPAAYAQLCADATGGGKTLHQVVREALRCSMVEGVSYLLIDNAAAGVYGSAAAEAAAGVRAIVRPIEACDVVWSHEWQDQIVAALILMEAKDGSPFLWYVDETEAAWITLSGDPKQPQSLRIAEVHPPVRHSYGGCPLVALEIGEDADESPMAGPWAECQKRIAIIESLLLEEIQGITFTTTVFLGVSSASIGEVVVGPGKGLCIPQEGTSSPSVDRLGADVAQAGSLRDQLAYEVAELYRAAGLSPGNPLEAGAPESGVAKAFAFNEVESRLGSLVEVAEAVERRITKLAAAGFNWPAPQPVTWSREFAPMDLAGEIDGAIRLDASGAPGALKAQAWEALARKGFRIQAGKRAALLTKQVDAIADPAERPTSLIPPSFPPTNPGRTAGT